MVRRCNGAGVRVYVDVIINHMTGTLEIKKGTAGSAFSYDEFSYPAVPYGADDFNRKEHCGSESGAIENYGDAQQVRNCQLVGLRDLNQGREHVRAKVAEFLNRLIGFGVAGFRVDAAKHMWPADLQVIYARLNDLNTQFFAPGTKPFIYQEVVDLGQGEAVTSWQYHRLGRVTEFRYGIKLGAVLRKRPHQLLKYLGNFGEDWGFLPSGDALTFVDNHDNQRGHGAGGADILTFFEPRLYKMANVFLLAWPYGLPRVMSSYRWPRDFRDGVDRNDWIGPPSDAAWNIEPVIRHSDNTCRGGWVCEHRWRQIYNLVELHNVAGFSPVTNWWDNGYHAIAFGRGNATFVVINNEDFRLDVILQTSLPKGTYCDVISGVKTSVACTGRSFVVKTDGRVDVTVDNLWEDPVIALHIEVRLLRVKAPVGTPAQRGGPRPFAGSLLLDAATSGGEVANRLATQEPPSPTIDDSTTPTTPTTPPVTDAVSADLVVCIDGHQVAALVDTGSHFSIISQKLADRLRKVKTPWTGPNIRTAGETPEHTMKRPRSFV
ncbi:alpha-amylase-like [Dermacentor andersoni]|uniref:alpha-amylase-like n=1 Tax=Dermacentor andersoni TaxID=34620 RepID=UPI003B3B0E14